MGCARPHRRRSARAASRPRRAGLVAVALTALLGGAQVPPAAAAAAGSIGHGHSHSHSHRHRPARRHRPITLEWVGDIALSTQRGLPPGGLLGALAPVRGLLRRADVTLGNLEGTLSAGGASKCGGIGGGDCFAFQAPPWIAGQLHALGFDLVNQANNHSMDYGAAGRAQTLAALRRAHIAVTGLPGQVTVLKAGGRRIAFVGFAPYPYDASLLDIPAAQALVRRARSRANTVVVIIHAGAEGADRLHTPHGSESYLGEDRGDPRAFAHAVIDAGASIVLGSGPHVIRGIQRYGGHPIAYSLGDFVGYHTLADQGVLAESAILRVTLSAKGRLLAARWIPIHLREGLPRPEGRGGRSVRLVSSLSASDFPHSHYFIEPDGRFRLRGAGQLGGVARSAGSGIVIASRP